MGSQCFSLNKHTSSIIYTYLNEQTINKYQFGRIIGKGSLSQVKIGYNKFSQEKYAIKIVDKAQIVIINAYSQVFNEKLILNKFSKNNTKQSPFITKLLQTYQDREKLYFVLQYAEYGNLRTFILQHKKLNLNQLKFFTICILLALKYLHQNQIVHGDLKPQNILINKNGYFKLCDFSSSLLYGSQSKDIKGTKSYKAPEVSSSQNKSKLTNNKSDMYSLGVIMWQLLHGVKYCKKSTETTVKLNQMAQLTSDQSDQQCQNHNNLLQITNFIQSLLKQNPKQRMSIQSVWQHPWLKEQKVHTQKYLNKQIQNNPFEPFQSTFENLEWQQVQSKKWEQSSDQLLNSVLLGQKKVQKMFQVFNNND